VLDIGASNVELVRELQPGPDVDVAQLFRDDEMWAAFADAAASFFDRNFECVLGGGDHDPFGGAAYVGQDGLRAGWLDWLAPWASYRTEIEEVIDVGERVLVLIRDFGRREGSEQEVEVIGAAVWTVGDGKVARAEFYADRAEALKAVGLPE
jgi:ketosteroid isomerase-like protein